MNFNQVKTREKKDELSKDWIEETEQSRDVSQELATMTKILAHNSDEQNTNKR